MAKDKNTKKKKTEEKKDKRAFFFPNEQKTVESDSLSNAKKGL